MKLNTNTAVEPLFYSVEQVAEITGLSVATIRRAIRDKRLGTHKFGRAVRVHRDDLNAYIDGSRGEKA